MPYSARDQISANDFQIPVEAFLVKYEQIIPSLGHMELIVRFTDFSPKYVTGGRKKNILKNLKAPMIFFFMLVAKLCNLVQSRLVTSGLVVI